MVERRRSTAADGRFKPADVVRRAIETVAELTGRQPESVLGLRKHPDGWTVTVEVVELSRVPNSTDVLGAYEVSLGDKGELLGFERTNRYARSQVRGGER